MDANPPAKKKRNLPGTPDPEAEVIALSPRTLLAINRFLCEICGKGFQRDQNLQLHRRGHNLPWKLRQRSGKEPRKRVYVCPENTCVHHNPARALGDLTGIKKHFCRKHGEKKWKCDKCSKRYAVQSDWKAHSKTCGTREYRCDCGTLFSRRDSFITHRAFCDALAEETAKVSVPSTVCSDGGGGANYLLAGGFTNQNMLQQLAASNILKPDMVSAEADQLQTTRQVLSLWMGHGAHSNSTNAASSLSNTHQVGTPFNGDLFSSCSNAQHLDGQLSWICSSTELASSSMPIASTQLKEFDSSQATLPGSIPSLFSTRIMNSRGTSGAPYTSATALLQKAAQMGMTSSTTPLVRGNTSEPASNAEDAGSRFEWPFSSPSNLHSSNLEAVISDFAAYRSALKDELGAETRDFLGVGAQTLCQPPIDGWI